MCNKIINWLLRFKEWLINNIWILGVAAFMLFVTQTIVLLITTWPVDGYTVEGAGQFGDSFGLLTSLFSGMAFCATLYVIILQKREFKDVINLQKKLLESQDDQREDSKNHAVMMLKVERASFQPKFYSVENSWEFPYNPSGSISIVVGAESFMVPIRMSFTQGNDIKCCTIAYEYRPPIPRAMRRKNSEAPASKQEYEGYHLLIARPAERIRDGEYPLSAVLIYKDLSGYLTSVIISLPSRDDVPYITDILFHDTNEINDINVEELIN